MIANGFYFVLLATFWSFSFVFIKISVFSLPPILSACLRVLIAQITLSLLFLATRQKLALPFASAWRIWGIGIFMQGLPFLLLFWGECFVSPALASIINSTVAAWALIFSILIFRDYSQASLSKLSGLVLGILGVSCIFIPLLMKGGQQNQMIGALAITGMAMSYGMGSLLNQFFCKSRYKAGFQASLWHQHWGSFVFLVCCTFLFERKFDISPVFSQPQLLFSLIYLGVFSTAFAWMIYHHLIASWGAVRACSAMFFVPLLTLLWDALFFHIQANRYQIYGVIFILSGVALIQFGKKRNPASR